MYYSLINLNLYLLNFFYFHHHHHHYHRYHKYFCCRCCSCCYQCISTEFCKIQAQQIIITIVTSKTSWELVFILLGRIDLFSTYSLVFCGVNNRSIKLKSYFVRIQIFLTLKGGSVNICECNSIWLVRNKKPL